MLCKQNQQTMQRSLQYQKMILSNNIVDHVLKNIEHAAHVRRRPLPPLLSSGGRPVSRRHVSLDLISSFLLNIRLNQHSAVILQHVSRTRLCSASRPRGSPCGASSLAGALPLRKGRCGRVCRKSDMKEPRLCVFLTFTNKEGHELFMLQRCCKALISMWH